MIGLHLGGTEFEGGQKNDGTVGAPRTFVSLA